MAYTENKEPLGLTAKTTPVDADVMVIGDSADASEVAKKTTWANIKATLKAYFDTLYGTLSNVVEDTTPQLGGNLDLNGKDITDGTTFKYDSANSRLSVGTDEQTISVAGATGLGINLGTETTGATDLVDFLSHRHSDTAGFGGHIMTGRSRGTHASPTIVQSGDVLNRYMALGYDGAEWEIASSIRMEVDGTPGVNDMPGRIIFLTTPDGSATPAEAMRISQDKAITMAGTLGVTGAITGSNLSGTNTGDEVAASDTVAGVIELATDAEMTTGTATDRAVTPANAKVELDKKLALAGGTMTGDIGLGSATSDTASIILNSSALADEKWSGTTITATAGATLAVGDVCYLASTGKWVLNDGILDGTDTGFSKKLGICVLASTDTNPTEILLDGVIASAAFPAFTVGSPVYLSDTAGDLIVAQPSTTNFAIRKVGDAVSATVLHFNPSNDYIVHV